MQAFCARQGGTMNPPKQIAENYVDIGCTKAVMPKGRMFLLAVLAGAFVALAGVAAVVGSAVAGKLAGACVFPAGLAMVVVAGSELFTGNNLMIISAMERRITVRQLLLAWLVVYIGNFAGSVLVAALAVGGGTFDAYYQSLLVTAQAKVSLSFGAGLLRGVLCNVLVCTAVWMAAAAKDAGGKIISLYLPIMAFVLCGFEHCVANMFYLPAGLFAAARYGADAPGLTWAAMFTKNLLPVTLGNMLGGVGLGALLKVIYLTSKVKS